VLLLIKVLRKENVGVIKAGFVHCRVKEDLTEK